MVEIKEGENIISIYRKHRFILFLELLPIALGSAIIAVVAFLFIFFLAEDMAVFIFLILFSAVLAFHISWLATFAILADFYLDVWVLTNKRVIFIEQIGLFSRRIIEFELHKIEDVTVDIRGMIETFMDFGNVTLYTASENPNFVFKHIKDPNGVKDAITNEISRLREKIK